MNQEGHTALEISTAKNVPASVRVLRVRREGGREEEEARRIRRSTLVTFALTR